METQTINHDSLVNQRIKGKLVERDVYLCMSSWVTDWQESNECWFDEFENLYTHACAICGEYLFDEEHEHDTDKDTHRCKYCDYEFDSNEEMYTEKPQEIFEYWAVSEWLYRKLRDYGEPVAEINNTYIWGRTTTGQAILLDWAISQICEGMEILEGQTHDWSKQSEVN